MSIFQTFLRFDIVLTFKPSTTITHFYGESNHLQIMDGFPQGFSSCFPHRWSLLQDVNLQGVLLADAGPHLEIGIRNSRLRLGKWCMSPPDMLQPNFWSSRDDSKWPNKSFLTNGLISSFFQKIMMWNLWNHFFFSKSNINSQQVGCGISANTIWLWLTVRHGKIHHAINR